MSYEIQLLTPLFIPLIAAGLLIAGSRFINRISLGGPLCLLVLAVTGSCLGNLGHLFNTGDPLAAAVQWSCLLFGVLYTFMTRTQEQKSGRSAEHFAMLLMSLSGLMLASVADNLILLFVAVELACLPIILLIWISRRESISREAAMKHFLMNVLSTMLLLYGFAFVYGLTGSTNLMEIQSALYVGDTPAEPHLTTEAVPRLGIVAMVLILAGLGYRLAVVPFHFGMSETYLGTTSSTTALLAVLPKIAALVVLIRVTIVALSGLDEVGMLLAMVLSGVTMVIGSAMALRRNRIREIIAYTTVAHSGFLLAGLAVGFWDFSLPDTGQSLAASLTDGITSALFFGLGYTLSITGLFAVLVYLSRPGHQIEYVEELTGLFRAEPTAAICISVLLLNLIGVPPLCGFWGRLLVISAMLSVEGESPDLFSAGPNWGFLLLALAAVCYLLLTTAVYLRLVIRVCLEGQVSRPQPDGGRGAWAVAVFTTLLVVGCGLLPGPVLASLNEIQESLRSNFAPVERSVSIPRGMHKRAPARLHNRLKLSSSAHYPMKAHRQMSDPKQVPRFAVLQQVVPQRTMLRQERKEGRRQFRSWALTPGPYLSSERSFEIDAFQKDS